MEETEYPLYSKGTKNLEGRGLLSLRDVAISRDEHCILVIKICLVLALASRMQPFIRQIGISCLLVIGYFKGEKT